MILKYFSDIWTAIAPAMGNHLWQSTLFAITAGLLTLALRKNRARARYWLWLAASVKFLVPFSLLVVMGSHLPWSRGSAGPKSGLSFVMKEVSQLFMQPMTPIVSQATPSTAHASLVHLVAVLLAVWLCGFLMVVFVWLLRWRRISAAIRQATPLHEGREVEAMRRLEHGEGIRKPTEIFLSRTSLEPGIFGIVRPGLVWPERITARLEDAHLEAILAHELSHVRHRDNLAAAIHMVVEAIFWFHPLVWWLGARLVEARERACDEAVLATGRDRRVYAESILRICEFCVESPLTCISGVTGADLKKRITRIMSEGIAHELDFGRKALLSAAALLSLTAPIALGLLRAPQLRAEPVQITGVPLPSFEGTSVWASPSGNQAATVRFVLGRLTLANWTTKSLIAYAYNTNHIVGGPAWIYSERYVVEVKVDDPRAYEARKLVEFDVTGTFPPGPQHDQLGLMLQSLLADRFKLKLSQETKQLPMYALVVAKDGPNLHEAKPDNTYADGITDIHGLPAGPHRGARQSGHLVVQSLPMSTVTKILSEQLGRTVLDKTGLTGEYDFTLDWTPDENHAAAGGQQDLSTPSLHESPGPSIFAAIEQQLGLKLELQKVPTEFLVIDHAEKPSEN
jgi:bla regulator protein blaR1